MSRILTSCLVLAAATSALLIQPRPARAQSRCTAQIRDRATRTIFAVSEALEQRTGLLEDEYTRLRGATADWNALASSRELRACAKASPSFDRWWRNWVRRFAEDTVQQAGERLAELCAPQVRSYLRRRIDLTEEALDRGDLAGARSLAGETEIALRSRDLFRTCQPTRDEVTHELDVTIPEIYDRVALPTVLRDLAASYARSRGPWDAAVADLSAPPDRAVNASKQLASADGAAALRQDLAKCEQVAAMARELGATDTTGVALPGGDRATVGAIDGWCRSTADRTESVLPKIATRVGTYNRIERERWERYHIDGWGMRKIYNALGRPDAVVRRGTRTEWRYRGEQCIVYVFAAHGRELSHTSGACPAPATAAR